MPQRKAPPRDETIIARQVRRYAARKGLLLHEVGERIGDPFILDAVFWGYIPDEANMKRIARALSVEPEQLTMTEEGLLEPLYTSYQQFEEFLSALSLDEESVSQWSALLATIFSRSRMERGKFLDALYETMGDEV